MSFWKGILAVTTMAMTVTGGEPAQSKPAADGINGAHLRVARPTDNLEATVAFYRDALGFGVMGHFEDHEGFDGVMLGHKGMGYHLEFTHHRGHKVGKAPTQDNLMVFYFRKKAPWDSAVQRMKDHGHQPVKSYNPYWDKTGKTFEDPDGYRVVFQLQQ